eukprot:scaffold239988_cov26-Tisochrysis_lutea.AAC.5
MGAQYGRRCAHGHAASIAQAPARRRPAQPSARDPAQAPAREAGEQHTMAAMEGCHVKAALTLPPHTATHYTLQTHTSPIEKASGGRARVLFPVFARSVYEGPHV